MPPYEGKASLLGEGISAKFENTLREGKEEVQPRPVLEFGVGRSWGRTLSLPKTQGRKYRSDSVPAISHGVQCHAEQGHYPETLAEQLFAPTPQDRKRVSRMWKTNGGCQYQTANAASSRPATAASTRQEIARRGCKRSGQGKRPCGETSQPSSQRSLSSSRASEAVQALEDKTSSLLDEVDSRVSRASNFKSFGAQGAIVSGLIKHLRAQSATPHRPESRFSSKTRVRPASAMSSQGIVEQVGPGYGASISGQHLGTLDRRSMLRFKMNIAATQPVLPPATPQLTGKARTARKRNLEIECPEGPAVPVAGLNEARSKFELSDKYNKETEIYINQYTSKKQ